MPFPPASARLTRFRRSISKAGLDGVVLRDRTTIHYLCGFNGSYGCLLVPSSGSPTLVTDSRYGEIAAGAVSATKVLVQPMMKTEEWFKDLFKKLNWKTVGFEGSSAWDAVQALRKRVGRAKLVPANEPLKGLRGVKDDAELRIIAKAAALADSMMALAWEHLKPGVREDELSRLIRQGSENLGGQGESFENIVATGPNSSKPHHHGGTRKARRGDSVTIDLGGRLGNYCSDLTRNPFIGSASAELEKIYNTVLAANEAALKACRPGMMGKELDAVAREVIATAGYGEYFGHGLGHGVGMEIHEYPSVGARSTDVLEEGHVITIEPGIYVPGLGGVRIEDLVVVTKGRPRILSKSPKGLLIIPG